MVSLTRFVAELLASAVQLVVIFLTEVAFRDPLAFVAFAMGGLLITASVGVFGYLVLGAALDLIRGDGGSLARTPPQRD